MATGLAEFAGAASPVGASRCPASGLTVLITGLNLYLIGQLAASLL